MALISVPYSTHMLRSAASAAAEATTAAEGAGAAGAAIDAALDVDPVTAVLQAIEIAASEVNILAYNTAVKSGDDRSAAAAGRLGGVDTYRMHKMMAARVTTAR
jgi:hypothetical protein